MMHRSRQVQVGRVEIYAETDSPNEKACPRYVMNQNRRMRRRASSSMQSRTLQSVAVPLNRLRQNKTLQICLNSPIA